MKGIVIGGGIGGLTTAIALLRKGIQVEVYESAEVLREAGAGIWMAPNALNVLQRLDLDQTIKAQGMALTKVHLADHQMHLLQTLESSRALQKFGHTIVAIHRARLQKVLLDSLDAQLVHTGKIFTTYEETAMGVRAHFTDGSSTEGDFLVGADGIHSKVRKSLLGDYPLRYSGQTCWRGVVSFKLPEHLVTEMYELWGNGPGLRFAFSHINDREVYFYATRCVPAGGKDQIDLKTQLHTWYRDFKGPVRDLIEATPQERILRNDLFDLRPLSYWTKGRTALLGDAAHATTPNLGQGACQAIEDAWVIADCLSKCRTIDEAFKQYQKIRISKAQYIVNTSYRMAQLNNVKYGWLRTLRNTIMRGVPSSVGYKQIDKVYKLNF